MRKFICVAFGFLGQWAVGQQVIEKEVKSYSQSWFSINSTLHISRRWGAVGDFHIRRNNFMADDFFYFLRAGVSYWVAAKYPVTVGIARLWLAPTQGNNSWSEENRMYQQWSAVMGQGRVSVLHRIRLEQRFRDVIVNDKVTGNKDFSLRLRYLASFDIKVFEGNKKPSVVISDEVLVQFGKSIVYNTFDQNRLFIGLKVPFNPRLSADIGYMNLLQQKSSGVLYDLSHTFRLFFYYNLDMTKNKDEYRHHEETE